jgi:hypothetical protein
MMDAWHTDQRAVYQWVRHDDSPPVTLLERPDKTLTGNRSEMDRLLHDAWDPIMRRYASSPEPDPAVFLQHYGQHIVHTPMDLDPITADLIQSRLSITPARKATGLDGWSVADLKRLPAFVLAFLADFLNLVEDTGTWPDSLSTGYISLIPKGEGMQPTQMRPLSVLSTIYRLWAGIRLVPVMAWQERWIHQEAYGFRTGRGAEDAWTSLSLLVELACVQKSPLEIIALDYIKCFDRVPQKVVIAIATAMGLHGRVVTPLVHMYDGLRRAFKIGGSLGAFFRATNGILQGCPLSVILINLLTTVWKFAMDHSQIGFQVTGDTSPFGPPPPPATPFASTEVPFRLPPSGRPPKKRLSTRYAVGQLPMPGPKCITALGYADDNYIVSCSRQATAASIALLERWLFHTGQGVNPPKSHHLAVNMPKGLPPRRSTGSTSPLTFASAALVLPSLRFS